MFHTLKEIYLFLKEVTFFNRRIFIGQCLIIDSQDLFLFVGKLFRNN